MLAIQLKLDIESRAIKNRDDAAARYALVIGELIVKDVSDGPEIGELNMAIVKRWSASGLDWIKKQAWDRYSQPLKYSVVKS